MSSAARAVATTRVVPGEPAVQELAFAQSVVRGLEESPRRLSCRYLYDSAGSALFEQITAQPEYYLTRVEDALLEAHAAEIRALTGPTTLVELGCGSATKTRHLLGAWRAASRTARYVPVDISHSAIAAACDHLRRGLPGLELAPLVGSWEQVFPRLTALSPLVLLFLGSSVGNLDDAELDDFLGRLATHLTAGDHVLLGIDLVKDVRTLEAAYNDAAGVTAAFTKNIFARMNRELDAGLNLDAIEHVAYYNAAHDRIEIYGRFHHEATLAVPALGRRFRIAPGEMVLVEISRKFTVEGMATTARRHGLALVRMFTDPTRAFGLLLLRRIEEIDPEAALRSRASRLLGATRQRTLELIAPLDTSRLTGQHSPLMSPIAWDLGHIANYEDQWVARLTDRARDSANVDRDELFDPIRHPRAGRFRLPIGGPADVSAYLTEARHRTSDALHLLTTTSSQPLARDGYLAAFLAQHEAQHTETMLQAIQLMPEGAYDPLRRTAPALADRRIDAREIVIPGGPFVMGTDDRTVAYDNERPAHMVTLPTFVIDATPVTNGDFLAFIRDGGYRRRTCWTDAAWLWLAHARVQHPAQWLEVGPDTWAERAFGIVEPLVLDRPVVHVSWFEAAAYARWAGKRLPTEAEWEKAAAWDLERGVPRRYPWGDAPATDALVNLDQRAFAPAAVGAYPRGRSYYGCHQMLGCVWEWTASDFLPYPGFSVFPYPEYSAVHFGPRHKVLRGGSWATQPIVARTTFRNWDLPQRRQIFAGFRCARDG